ncbi:MAG: thrombospondin type 3 repeat-containing protein [Alphaproteobacteria bacterium]|nr:thrombospondin type 3 repeat-containing protein [Alphaproteobacteria bacterium]
MPKQPPKEPEIDYRRRPRPNGRLDSDGDGIPDEDELKFGLNPFDPNDAKSDLDRDGRNALQEYREGTNPRKPELGPVAGVQRQALAPQTPQKRRRRGRELDSPAPGSTTDED